MQKGRGDRGEPHRNAVSSGLLFKNKLKKTQLGLQYNTIQYGLGLSLLSNTVINLPNEVGFVGSSDSQEYPNNLWHTLGLNVCHTPRLRDGVVHGRGSRVAALVLTTCPDL